MHVIVGKTENDMTNKKLIFQENTKLFYNSWFKSSSNCLMILSTLNKLNCTFQISLTRDGARVIIVAFQSKGRDMIFSNCVIKF